MALFFITMLVIVVVFAVIMVSIYNKLITYRNRYKNAFAQIEVQLKRRYDLIPNLVETAKAYMSHERETLEAVISARNQALAMLKGAAADPSGAAIQNLAGAEGVLQSAMGKLNFVMEAYPELKANENMMQLTEELSSTENKVAFSRQSYNDSVMQYNTYRQSFPQNIFSSSFGHPEDAVLLEFEDSAEIQKVPKVSF